LIDLLNFVQQDIEFQKKIVHVLARESILY